MPGGPERADRHDQGPSTSYFARDPYGTLVAQHNADGTEYSYLVDGQRNAVALEDPGTIVGSYDLCPTGNEANGQGSLTQAALNNPFRLASSMYDDDLKDYFGGGLISEDYAGTATQLPGLRFGGLILPNSVPVGYFILPWRKPDYYTAYLNLPIPDTFGLGGVTLQATVDRYGNTYLGSGGNVGLSATGISGSVTGGYILQNDTPSPSQVSGFITNLSISAGAGFGSGAYLTYGNVGGGRMSDYALEVGVATPQIGYSHTVTSQTPVTIPTPPIP